MLLSFKSTLSWSFLQSLCLRIKPQSLLKRRIRTHQMREAPLILAYLNQRIKTTSAINIHLSSSPADRFLKASSENPVVFSKKWYFSIMKNQRQKTVTHQLVRSSADVGPPRAGLAFDCREDTSRFKLPLHGY